MCLLLMRFCEVVHIFKINSGGEGLYGKYKRKHLKLITIEYSSDQQLYKITFVSVFYLEINSSLAQFCRIVEFSILRRLSHDQRHLTNISNFSRLEQRTVSRENSYICGYQINICLDNILSSSIIINALSILSQSFMIRFVQSLFKLTVYFLILSSPYILFLVLV